MILCYVLPAYDSEGKEHYAHIPHLLEVLSEIVPVVLLIEKAEGAPILKGVDEVRIAGRPGSSRILRSVQFARHACAVAKRGDVTFFLRYSRLATTILIVLRTIVPLKICYWMSGSALLQFDRRTFSKRVEIKLHELHTKWLLRKVDKVFTGPETMLAYMSKHWKVPDHKLSLLYNDIDTDRFRPPHPGERDQIREDLSWQTAERVVLFVHRLSARRGSRLIVPVTSRLCQELHGKLRVVVVGDGPGLKELLSAIELNGLDELIEVKGGLPNRTLPDLYRAADCFLMPSYEEGFPRVVIEAMASGLPVVATESGGTRDVLGKDYPYCVPVGDVEGLVEGLKAVLEGPTNRAEIGTSLRQIAIDRFSTKRVSRMMVTQLER
jgi:glycosyltransferase involved in cell wall biosynthesis